MAKKSRQSFLKRQRETRRAEKASLKRQKRMERRAKATEGDETGAGDIDGTEPEYGSDEPLPEATADAVDETQSASPVASDSGDLKPSP